jgi:EmrB/QacA subfamily drug resistance transporter
VTQANADPTPATGHPDRWRILVVLCAALCIVVLDNTILSVAVPSVGAQLGASESHLQWIVAAYGLVIAALLLPLAGIGDRYGRRRLLLVGIVGFGVASALASFAQSANQLVAARALMGVGGAATMPATLAVLSNVFPEHERPRAIALWSGVSSLAAAAGPVIGGFLLDHFWWGAVFLVNVPFTALVFAGAWRLVPDSKDPATPPLDRIGSVIWSCSLGLLLLACIEGGERGWGAPIVVGPAVVGLVLLGTFGWWERRTPHPLLSPAALAHPKMQAGIVVVPVLFFTVFGLQFVTTQWLQGVRGLTPLAAGACFVPHAAAVLVGSLSTTRISERIGLARTVVGGMSVMAAGLLIPAVAGISLATMIAAVVVLGFGMGVGCPAGVELIMGSVPPEQAGQAAGVNETIVEAGGALGVAVMGSVLTAAAGGAAAISHHHLVTGGEAARANFTDALATPLLVGIGALALGIVVTLWRARRADADSTPDR